jgi:hypothetical protein
MTDHLPELYRDPMEAVTKQPVIKELRWPFAPGMDARQAFLAMCKWSIPASGCYFHAQFAESLGWAPNTLSVFLSGHRPMTWDRIGQILKGLGDLDPIVYDLLRLLALRAYLPAEVTELPCIKDALSESIWNFRGAFSRLIDWDRPMPDQL